MAPLRDIKDSFKLVVGKVSSVRAVSVILLCSTLCALTAVCVIFAMLDKGSDNISQNPIIMLFCSVTTMALGMYFNRNDRYKSGTDESPDPEKNQVNEKEK